MKKFCCLLIAAVTLLLCGSCSFMQTEDAVKPMEPQIAQMRNICELATMKCYYHNVARYYEKNAVGFLMFSRDKNFWIEYSGMVTIGVDASLVTITVDGEDVTITIPPAKILGCKVDEKTLTEDSFVVAANSVRVEAKDQTTAFREAQAKMEQTASQDTVLLANAQQKAQMLLEDYVKNLGNCFGKDYRIHWVYVADNAAPSQSNPTSSDTVTAY